MNSDKRNKWQVYFERDGWETSYTGRSPGLLTCSEESSLPLELLAEKEQLLRCTRYLPRQESTIKVDKAVPRRWIIAEINAFQRVLSQEHSVLTSKSNSLQKSDITFNFSDSPVPDDWKEHTTKKLNNMPEVYARNDLNFGWTDRVKHKIKLSDETPFKHRAHLTWWKCFSVLDLKSGYYQIEVEETDKPKTAFVCPMGITFQHLMERCMGNMFLKEVLVFLDHCLFKDIGRAWGEANESPEPSERIQS